MGPSTGMQAEFEPQPFIDPEIGQETFPEPVISPEMKLC